jgi:hypothetical protein
MTMSTVDYIVPLMEMTSLAAPEKASAGSWHDQVGSDRKCNSNLLIVQ